MMCACEMGAGMWSLMFLPGLLLAALLIGATALIKGFRGRSESGPARETSAVSLLEERYARGEIDGDEFRERRERLRQDL